MVEKPSASCDGESMKTTRIVIAVTATALALTVSACSGSLSTRSENTADSTQSSSAATATSQVAGDATETPTATATEEQSHAKEPFADTDSGLSAIAAAAAVANGTVMEVDREDRDQVWEIHVLEDADDVEYLVDANGKATEKKRKPVDSEDAMRILGAIPLADAVKAAQAQVRDGYLDEVEIDNKDSQIVYVISFDDASGNDYKDVHLDPQTGEVITVKEHR